jgi:predicted RNA binding protein YcfA (HicA-like mRNA interferase family)
MPKLPRSVSHDRLVRFLHHHGWRVVREGARHSVLGKDGLHISVPRHAELRTGTVAAILRQAEIDADARHGL